MDPRREQHRKVPCCELHVMLDSATADYGDPAAMRKLEPMSSPGFHSAWSIPSLDEAFARFGWFDVVANSDAESAVRV